jgi:RNA-directed DNA polymerase
VIETITEYIEKELKLKVNRTKSRISQPDQSNLLGFSFFQRTGKWEIGIATKSLRRIKEKIKKETQRKDPARAGEKIKKIEAIIVGWVNYFRIAQQDGLCKDWTGWYATG